MSKNLQDTIRQLANDFAAGVVAAIRAASLQDLQDDAPSRRASAKPRRVPRPSTQTHAVKGRAPKPALGADELLDTMVETAKKFAAGLRSEEFRQVLKLDDKALFRKVANEAVAAKLLKKTGEKRATTYYPL